jgi:hypothetical protein
MHRQPRQRLRLKPTNHQKPKADPELFPDCGGWGTLPRISHIPVSLAGYQPLFLIRYGSVSLLFGCDWYSVIAEYFRNR